MDPGTGTIRSSTPTRALFWVAPARRLYDLFTQLDGLREPEEVVRRSAAHGVHFLPPEAWPAACYLPGNA